MRFWITLLFLAGALHAQPWADVTVAQPTFSDPGYTNVALDYFTTEAGGLPTVRAAEPGPGYWTVTTNDGAFVITNSYALGETNIYPGAALLSTAQATYTVGDLKLMLTNTLARVAGRAVIAKIRPLGNSQFQLGFERTTVTGDIDESALVLGNGSTSWRVQDNLYAALNSFTFNNDYELAVVTRPTRGAWYFMRGGEWSRTGLTLDGMPAWVLIGTDELGTDATVTPAVYFGATSGVKVDSLRVVQLTDAVWQNRYHGATDYRTTSTNGATLTMNRDAILEHYVKGQTGVEQELKARMLNDSNYVVFRMNTDGGWSKLLTVSNATESLISSNVQAFVNNTWYRVQLMMWSSNVSAKVNGGSRGSTTTAICWTNVSLGAYASHAGSNFVAWAAMPDITIQPLPKSRQLISYGDSKNFGGFDTVTPPTGAIAGWQKDLIDGLNTNNTLDVVSVRTGHSGDGVNTLSSRIATDIQAIPQQLTPTWITVNIGANDCATTIDATYTNSYANILDSLHAAWPSARVYVMQIWAKSCANLTSVRSCAAGLVAARSSWCSLGPDESVFLENGDDGATTMVDSTHPNRLGYMLTAQEWREALGL